MLFFHPLSFIKKILLTIIIVSLAALAITSFYLMNHPDKKAELEEKIEPNYQEFMKLALKHYEDAESALIYQDSKKAKKLLEKSKDYAKQVVPSRDLYQDAKDLLAQIEDKLKKLNKTDKEEKD